MKTKNTLASAVAGIALLTGGSAMAQSSLSEIDWLGGWSGSASLSGLFTTGNSESTNISGSASVAKQIGLWRHTAFGSNYTAKNDVIRDDLSVENVETADRFDIGYKVDRQFNDRLYGFGRLRYDTDDFGNIDNRYAATVGAGYRILDDGKQALSGELGIGGHDTTYDRPLGSDPLAPTDPNAVDANGLPIVTEVAGEAGATEDSGALLYGALNYSNILNEYLTFNSNFSFEAADSNTLTVWDNSLNVKVSDNISLSLGILTRNNSDIEGQLGENTDTATRVGLVFGI